MTDSLQRAPRLYRDESLNAESPLPLSKDQSHYLRRVLRLSDGDIVKLFNGRDGEWTAHLSSAGSKSDSVTPHRQLRPQFDEPDLSLLAAPIKRAHFEFTLEKATELGVHRIQPILTERTQIRDVNPQRARLITIEAAEQSERMSLPSIGAPFLLEVAIKSVPLDQTLLVCAEWGDAEPLAHVLRSLKDRPKKCAIVVGPEGGFTEKELTFLRAQKNSIFARLGPRILRADTAALAALAAWQTFCGDW